MNLQQLENHWKFFPGKRLERGAFRRIAASRLKGRILDVGGGLSPYRDDVNGQKYFCLELSSQHHPDLVGSAMALPFKPCTIDGIICTEVLEHLPSPETCVKEMKRVLGPGGLVYITVPMLWCLHYEPHDYFRFTNHGLKHLIEQCGLRIVTLERVGGLFTFIVLRLWEHVYQIGRKFFFFVPRPYRFIPSMALFSPLFAMLQLVALLDRFNRKDAYVWAVLATTTD